MTPQAFEANFPSRIARAQNGIEAAAIQPLSSNQSDLNPRPGPGRDFSRSRD
jgi:hypothetical protein